MKTNKTRLYGFCDGDVDKQGNVKNAVIITENIFLIDGYSFGDTLLEGVMFEVTFDDKTVTNIEVDKESKKYFENLNQKKWLAACKKEAEMILQSGDEVELPERLTKKYEVDGAYIMDDLYKPY